MPRATGRPPADDVLRRRVNYLADVLFMGSDYRMSEATGVPRSTITKTRNGDRSPGERMLAALASHPRVNADWLLRGEGDPLIPSTSGTLPVATAVLPGPPNDHSQLLSGDRHPVAAVLERDSRYWLRLSVHISLRLRGLSMLPDDMLLLETHEDHICRPDVYVQHLCAMHVFIGKKETYTLGRVVDKDDGLLASIYGDARMQTLEFTPAASHRHLSRNPAPAAAIEWRPRRRSISRVKDLDEGPKARTPKATEERPKALIHGIVGLVLQLVRPAPMPVASDDAT